MSSQNGTDGRVYGGDCDLIHVADGQRAIMGRELAVTLDERMREAAFMNESRTAAQAVWQDLCPGCYMIVLFNAAVELARENGQSLSELGRTMSAAFGALANNPDGANMEEINVILDGEQ